MLTWDDAAESYIALDEIDLLPVPFSFDTTYATGWFEYFLDLLDPALFIYSLDNNSFYKEKIKLPKPLGNIYPHNNGNFYLSCFNGLYNYNRRTKKITKVIDVRKDDELKHISYNDGTITKNKLWISLCHLKETEDLGYFGYLT